MQREGLERELTREELLALKNKRTGLLIFQLSWILVFVVLILVNGQLRLSYPSWPPPGVEKLGPGLPTLATALLLASSFLARRARRAIEVGHHQDFEAGWRTAIILGALFVLIMSYEWLNAPMGTQYGTIFRVMTGFHGVHALVIGGFMMHIYRGSNRYGPHDSWPVEAAAKLWYFVAFAWMLFYLVLYWI